MFEGRGMWLGLGLGLGLELGVGLGTERAKRLPLCKTSAVMFEGWSMGFEPVPAHAPALRSFPGMDIVNRKLAAYVREP